MTVLTVTSLGTPGDGIADYPQGRSFLFPIHCRAIRSKLKLTRVVPRKSSSSESEAHDRAFARAGLFAL